jgi:hypothetical protein
MYVCFYSFECAGTYKLLFMSGCCSWIHTIYMWSSIDEESALGWECWLGVVYVWIYWWDSFGEKGNS